MHAAAGGVGSTLVQLAKARGATVIATVGTEEKAQLARGFGADHVIDYADGDFAEAVRAIVGDHAVDVAYDSVGKETWERSLSLLKPRGMFALFGNSSGPVPPVEPQRSPRRVAVPHPPDARQLHLHARGDARARARPVRSDPGGKLHVRIGATYPLAKAAQAHRDLEARKTTGKLLLIP